MNSAVPTEYPGTAATTGRGTIINENFVGSGSGSRMDPRRIGAFAAIALGVLQLLSTIFGIAAKAPIPNDVDPGRDLAKVTANTVLMSGQSTLRALAGLSLIVLALALAQWLQAAAPFAVRVATGAAVISGALIIMDNVGRLGSYDALAQINGKDHSAAVAAYAALIVVGLLHATASFVMLGVFVLTSAVVAARSRVISRPLWFVGIVFGIALIGAHVTGLPSLVHMTGFSYVSFALGIVMGPLLIIWPIWLGVELLRGRPTSVADLGVTTPAPA
ncbi:MAG: hypothetical protein M3082_13915 [Candidatus Dormibacteraeota bacterium]|nr:hypothetical protein [Candidatus Dormibacteraeota bacterium]